MPIYSIIVSIKISTIVATTIVNMYPAFLNIPNTIRLLDMPYFFSPGCSKASLFAANIPDT